MAHMLISGGASCLPVTPGSIPGSGQSSGLWWFQAIVEKDHQDKQSPMGGGTSPAPNVPRARLRGPRGFSQALPHLTTLDCPDELKVSPETGNSHHDTIEEGAGPTREPLCDKLMGPVAYPRSFP
jgi:hypothetical protein